MNEDALGLDGIAGRGASALAELHALRAADAPTHGGRVLSYVYDPGIAELDRIAGEAARLVQPVNGLDPTVFPSARVLERDLVAWGAQLTHGGDGTVGNVTSGGTESCMLAVLSARDSAGRGGEAGDAGSIVIPTTAHAAFVKAAHVLGLGVVRVAVDPSTGRVDPARIAAALRDDTVLVVASAPNYPLGALDPIAEIAEVTGAAGVPLHVDACLGGFALAWWDESGAGDDTLPPWDFRVPGVTTLSLDLHKYGYAPKGASLLLHRDRDRHRAQYFGLTDWPGYPVVNPTLLGSKSLAATASAWAIAHALGDDGYRALVGRIRRSVTVLREAVDATAGLRVVGDPVGPVFAVAADGHGERAVDPHRWAAAVAERGFTLQMQPSLPQPDGTTLPATTHLTVTPVTESVLGELVVALREAATEVRGVPPAQPLAALATLAAAFEAGQVEARDVTALPSAVLAAALAEAGLAPGGPGELDMAAVLSAVEALPREVTRVLLIEYLAGLLAPG
ncbi:aspartate aminotransferase family protein [Rhodococcus rhodnii]|uniref:Pyridoxal-dependent decarboxylase n=2 Tax=Rhodococcus rhodnii TaxID=38312 RepID=R7WTK3_9NOCA|nr:aminotransferase class V-fold PLP-dependent enzyme [Rhodococcus rhodnii]EOM78583.1 hypothetical protein Rrhod_0121 [Rhodococcus rhodnii LMG 5362]TXG91366.1 aspartate aminotransferase family protein [Rhodococcus rhodnii]